MLEDNTELFNLKEDISESKNLANFYPQKVREMKRLISEYDKDLKANIH